MARSRKGLSPAQQQRGSTDAFNAVKIASEEERIVEGQDVFSYKIAQEEDVVETKKPTDDTPIDPIKEEVKKEDLEEPKKEPESTISKSPFGYKDVPESPTDPLETPDLTETGKVIDDQDVEINPYYHLAQGLAKDGFFEGEIAEDIDGSTLLETTKRNLKEEALRQIRQEANSILESEGYNAEDLKVARMVNAGIDPKLLSEVNRYKALGSVNVEEADDNVIKQVITNYYQDRTWKPAEIQERLESLELEDKIKEVGAEAVKHFNNKGSQLEAQQEQVALQRQQQAEQQAQEQKKIVENLVQKGELLGEKVKDPKSFRSAIYNQDFTAEINGKEYPISELQKFMLEFQNDPETKLWTFNKWRNKDSDVNQLKEDLKSEVEEDFLADYKKIVTKDRSKTTTRRVKEKILNTKTSDWVSPTGNRGPIVIKH